MQGKSNGSERARLRATWLSTLQPRRSQNRSWLSFDTGQIGGLFRTSAEEEDWILQGLWGTANSVSAYSSRSSLRVQNQAEARAGLSSARVKKIPAEVRHMLSIYGFHPL